MPPVTKARIALPDRYRVVRHIANGGMASVWAAEDELLGRLVAVKVLSPGFSADAAAARRFQREARTAAQVSDHLNVVTIYDVGEHDGVAYIAMELLEGKSLQQILRETPRLPLDTIADLVAQVADGLDLAQRYKITHRDIKPANIMVSADWRAKLTDFGVAHVASSSMTQTGTALGSPKYMSPEQVTGQPLDPRSDIFSLGVVLYEMLVGRTPFERKSDTTVFALMNRIAGEPHAPVTSIDPKIPAAFDAILDKALGKSPDKRYQRGSEMAQDLRNYKLPAGAAAPARTAPGDPMSATLIDDFNVFAKDFEKKEQEALRAEAAERARKEEELRRWGEAEEKRRQEFERTREVKSGATLGTQRRSAALDLLKQKAADKTTAVDVGRAKRDETAAHIDERLRAAFRYLSEFATVLNEATPVSDGKQGVMFFGERNGMILGEGFTDLRTRDLDGKSRADYITFKYRVSFPKPEKLEVTGEEAKRVQERLKAMGIKHEARGQKNELGQLLRATFVLSGPFPCQALLRADYDDPGFTLDLVNVRHHGQNKLRLGPDELNDDVLDEFGTWVLGADDAFERFLKRK